MSDMDTDNEIGYWFCKNCSEELSSCNVNYQELCCICGHPAEWIEADTVGLVEQLTAQLADETAERKRLEDNEDAMVAYHDELARDLAEADDAIVENCRLCRKYGKAKRTCASMTKTAPCARPVDS
jgi:hypothetical protein